MIDDYRGLAVFVAVVDAGSFSAAARRLKLSTSVVSHHVSKLETKLGTPLFVRSTRSLALTGEGSRIIDAARRMVLAGEEAIDTLAADTDQPFGTLRITLPAFGDASPLHQALWEFARTHPLVKLSINNSDKPVDLVKDGYDLAIRLGVLADSSLKSRRIGTFHRILAASVDYIAQKPPIRTFDELIKQDFVSVSILPRKIGLIRDGETLTFTPETYRIEVDTIAAAIAAVRAGLGIQHLPESEIKEDLATGRLVEVLPEWRLPELGVYAVWPDLGQHKQLTRRLLDFLLASLADPVA
ncbi:MAG: LysR family transcriptional regulator [Pseudomonadota bacterium]